MALNSDRCVWARGNVDPASINDLTFLRGGPPGEEEKWDPEALYNFIPEGTKAIGDNIYSGQPDKVATTRSRHSVEVKRFFAHAKSRQ